MTISRRALLKRSAGVSALMPFAAAAPNFLLQTASVAQAEEVNRAKADNVLVVLQLTGGNDGLNTVIPYTNDEYHKHRRTLRVAAGQVLKLNAQVGLHPAMKGMHRLFEQDQVAVVQGVGYPNPNRSHFESMDIWQSSEVNLPKGRTGRTTGWLGRYLDHSAKQHQKSHAAAIHIGGEKQPLALAGDQVHSVSLRNVTDFKLKYAHDTKHLKTLERQAMLKREGGDPLLEFLQKSTVGAMNASHRIQDALDKYRTDVKYPNTPLGNKMKTIAQLIDAELNTRIYYISLDGFDTHARQAGSHQNLLAAASDAVTAFMDDLKQHHHDKRVSVLMFSEFGRRVHENASAGTDHGAAGPVFLVGGNIAHGIKTPHPSMTDLDQGDLRYAVDFRQIYGSILKDWMGVQNTKAILGSQAFGPLKLFNV